MPKYRILSLDGGGIRGVIAAVILQRLEHEAGINGWLQSVDLIAGTSTGGLLGLGIAHGLTPEFMRGVYEKDGPDIFDDSWVDDLRDLGKITGAEYDLTNLEAVLKRIFGRTTLSQLKRRVLITSFDLDGESNGNRSWKPKLFHNFPGIGSDEDMLAYKVGMYTSAAPTYFPSYGGYIDGGVYANNPSMCALAQSLDRRYRDNPSISELVLFSVGTGTSLQYIKGQELDWGYAQWAKPLVGLMLDGVAGIADYQCARLLDDRYHRLAPIFPPRISVPMDDVDRLPYMIRFAEKLDLGETISWLASNWM